MSGDYVCKVKTKRYQEPEMHTYMKDVSALSMTLTKLNHFDPSEAGLLPGTYVTEDGETLTLAEDGSCTTYIDGTDYYGTWWVDENANLVLRFGEPDQDISIFLENGYATTQIKIDTGYPSYLFEKQTEGAGV